MIVINKIDPVGAAPLMKESVKNKFFRRRTKADIRKVTGPSFIITNIRRPTVGKRNFMEKYYVEGLAQRIKVHLEWFYPKVRFQVKVE